MSLRQMGVLRRSTPVRLVLTLVSLFTFAALVTFGAGFYQIRATIKDRITASLAEQAAGFEAADNQQALARQVEAEAVIADPADRILIYIVSDKRLAGNANATISGTTILFSSGPGGRELSDDGYEVRTIEKAGGVLILADSLAPISDLEESFSSLAALSLLPAILLSLAAGIGLALADARRVRRIESALIRLAEGQLSARVGADGKADDLSRIGAAIDRLAAAQQSATSALKQISADIAHDLKTPIQRISVALAELERELPPETRGSELCYRALAEATRASAVFQGLLQIAQIEGGSPISRFERLDLRTLAGTIMDLYEADAEARGQPFGAASFPEDPVLISGDRDLIGQALANMIENCFQHTPPGTQVSVGLEMTGSGAVLSVADNGPGIPVEDRDLVLRRLYRLERSRTTPGNGLGLALVSAVADLHGAKLFLEDNQPGLRISIAFQPSDPG